MKKLTFFISLCLLVGGAVSAQTLQSRVNKVVETVNKNEAEIKEVESKIDKLSDRFDNLEYAVEKQKDIIAQEQTAIDNSLSAANHNISIFSYIVAAIGIIIAIGSFAFGAYFSKKTEQILESVDKKRDEIDQLKQEITKIKDEAKGLNDEIKDNVDGLFNRLRRDDTISLLGRLVDVPEDIGNIFKMLLARKLHPSDFNLLLKAYTKLMSENKESAEKKPILGMSQKEQYLLLFFQHFCGKSIQSSLLKDDVISHFFTALQCAFKIDVRNSLSSLVETLNNFDINGENESILAEYLVALNKSRHRTYTEPYQLIVDNCNDTINLQSVWNKLVEQNVIIEPFGNLLSTKYRSDAEFVKTVKTQIEGSKQEKEEKGATAQKEDDKSLDENPEIASKNNTEQTLF